ncbi:MAG: diguanylate cyclase [Phycisphaerales bacterium]|nr:diguanylate cyclase [Phycisphaerales bacterium]
MQHSAGQQGELRVILVGQTGLDAQLRRDPGLELIRARTALDALGELSDPLDRGAPGRAVVIVDPRAEPSAAGAGDLTEFLAGLRRVDPQVRVLRVARNGDAAPAGYDGQLAPDTDASGLRRFIANGSAPAQAPGAIEPKPASAEARRQGRQGPAAPEPLAPALPEPQAPAASARAGDEAGGELLLLRRLADGEPVLAPAMDLLRARAGGAELRFAPAGERSGCANEPHAAAPVRVGEELVGELCSPTMRPADLGPAAAWLGAWLELERTQTQLREAAYRDPLTGAWNRRYFDEFLPQAIEEAGASRHLLTVLLFDIDNFKRFNDAHGHAAGDEILTECVRLLHTAVRPTDKVCRIGGDEFAVIFHEPEGPREPNSRHPTSVHDIAERFRRLVCGARFSKLGDDAPGHLTISGGLATFPWDGRTSAELMQRADELALEGKSQGKNVIALGPRGCGG